jgi:hypothetical protein
MDIQKLEIELTKFTQWLIENRPDYKGNLLLDMNDYLARAKGSIEDSNCTIPDVIKSVCECDTCHSKEVITDGYCNVCGAKQTVL